MRLNNSLLDKEMSDMNGIPVLLLGYNRPELLRERFHELIMQQPSALYVSIDGGTQSESQEMNNLIKEIEIMSETNTTVILRKQSTNLGLARHVTSAIDYVFSRHTKLIIVEDDISLSRNFYLNMCSGFETIGKTNDTAVVSAFSPRATAAKKRNHWRKSVYFSPWGWGTSRDFWNEYKLELKNEDFVKSLRNSKTWNSLGSYQKKTWMYRFEKISENPLDTWDIQFQYLLFKKGTPCLLPKFRIVDNQGYSDPRSVHTKEAKPRWFKDGVSDSGIIPVIKNPRNEILAEFIDAQTMAGDSRLAGYWKKLRTYRIVQYFVQFLP